MNSNFSTVLPRYASAPSAVDACPVMPVNGITAYAQRQGSAVVVHQSRPIMLPNHVLGGWQSSVFAAKPRPGALTGVDAEALTQVTKVKAGESRTETRPRGNPQVYKQT